MALGSVRIASTYRVFSHTWDEPFHIAAGLEWLTRGTYQFDQQHPPLARIAAAIGPVLVGTPPWPAGKMTDPWMLHQDGKMLYDSGRYEERLLSARLGILPFFWIACAVVYLWARRYAGRAAAVLAVFLFSFFPAVLAHAGLATTDMACTAMLAAAFLAGCVFLEEPSSRHAIVFGICGGLAILSKFSVLAYFPACAAVSLAWYALVERPGLRRMAAAAKSLAPLLAMAAAISAVVVWAGFRFSFAHGVPAPEFWSGIQVVGLHNRVGQWSYLLGELRQFGVWYFFPVAIALKTPIAFLILAAAGAWLAVRNRGAKRFWLGLAYACGILGVAMSSNINLGLRHVLPMYVGLAVLGGAGLAQFWACSRRNLAIGAILLAWMAAASLISHPDYLAYFNELAGSRPERFLVDSDLDWGQDVGRLGRRLRELGAREVTFIPGDRVDWSRQPGFAGITVNEHMSWAAPTAGWNAVGLTGLKRRLGFLNTHPELTLWPEIVPPTERVGKSILLWYVPPRGSIPTIPFPTAPPAGQGNSGGTQ